MGYPLRSTIEEHLYSFKKYSNSHCYYLGLDSVDTIPEYLLKIDFNLIIFHYGFISSRWSGKEHLLRAVKQVEPIFGSKAVKIVMPQDEYKNSEDICWFINEYNIDCLFSVSPQSEWPILYPTVDRKKVRFYQVLTGYLDDDSVKKLNSLSNSVTRNIDIGYRARNLPPWLGKHGYAKTEIAGIIKNAANKFNLKVDISIDPKDTFLGDEWYKFMLSCKYFIGVEGGATVHDPKGDIWKKGETYISKYPNASFEEVEKECFPNEDGKLKLIAISPRHLEACATKTCQILIESTFNGILKANLHYIPLKEDYSNVNEVMQLVKDDNKRKEITERAYNDIVLSEKWSYKQAVKDLINDAIGVDVSSHEYLSIKEEKPDELLINIKQDEKHWRYAELYTHAWYRYYARYKGKLRYGAVILAKGLGAKIVYNQFKKFRN
ncbi:MAG: hypothetical protein IPM51_02735 [Sphingobacteriaceae bacterium]|nr:hypothetical protein [Sphingobacteriaceae bacterium]